MRKINFNNLTTRWDAIPPDAINAAASKQAEAMSIMGNHIKRAMEREFYAAFGAECEEPADITYGYIPKDASEAIVDGTCRPVPLVALPEPENKKRAG